MRSFAAIRKLFQRKEQRVFPLSPTDSELKKEAAHRKVPNGKSCDCFGNKLHSLKKSNHQILEISHPAACFHDAAHNNKLWLTVNTATEKYSAEVNPNTEITL